ncbi:Fanconi anemia group F protein [Genypterus blacodes]|uniref:Fanconi anemia group F protein n=1 Tax=Genypterus blacodes TaxID=154954 RepID=UPI003F772FA6
MEAVLEEVAHTVELLAVCESCGSVSQWDEHTVSRACAWASYCEKLFIKFHHNPTVRALMDKQLQVTNQRLRAAFPGHRDISFLDLSQCQHLLLGRLLSNPALPFSIIKILFSTSGRLGDEQGVTGLCSQLIQCRSACKILAPVTDSHGEAVGADAEVQGEMLMERLDALLNPSGQSKRAENFLDSVPRGCPGTAEHFCLVIAAALLTRTNTTQTAAEDFLLSWLQRKPSLLQDLCSALPAALLTDLSKKHVNFKVAYCDTLKKWASEMEYDINEGEWRQTSSKPTVSFQKLTQHFVALLEACPSLRDDLEKELKALKVKDGDYDVEGLSVWGDVLSEIHRWKIDIRL